MSLEASLEDYVWGRIRESEYLEQVAHADTVTAEAILSRVQHIDTDLNRQLRKGVEENLSRLLDQTTALEGLERRQRSVHAHMQYVKEGVDRISRSLSSQLDEYREGVQVAERILAARNLLSDAQKCEELMEKFEKRRDLVKRSELICELRAIVKENKDLRELAWLRVTVDDKLKKAVAEIQATASEDLRRGLETLNASTVSAAKRALANLGLLDGELEAVLTRAVAYLDAAFLDLATAPAKATTLLPTAVNGVQSAVEQAALLGDAWLARFADRLARTMRARVPVDAPYALRLVQSISRVLHTRPSSAAIQPLFEALRPLKHAILSQSLSRLHEIINEHDLATSPTASRFVELLTTRMEEELRLVEWDSELHAEALRNLGKCFDLVAQKIEAAMRLDDSSLLLGDRPSTVQQANYRLLQAASSLAAHWPALAAPMHRVHSEATSSIVAAVRKAIEAILCSMHGEKLRRPSEGRECSAYMQELVAYLGRLSSHTSHAPSSLGSADVISNLADGTLLLFLLHASLIRADGAGGEAEATRLQLRRDLDRLLTALDELGAPLGLAAYATRDDTVLRGLFAARAGELDYSSSPCVPLWLFVHFLIADSPSDIVLPHDSIQYTREEYARWVLGQGEAERLRMLSGLLDAYTAGVVQKGGTTYVPNYPKMVDLLERARKQAAQRG